MKMNFVLIGLAAVVVAIIIAVVVVRKPAGTTIITGVDATKLQMEDVKVGDGKLAEAGKDVVVHYVGTLTNGKEFDSSRGRNEPFTFKLGAGMVIKGWDQGVVGMKVGGMRKLVIPSTLGYGAAGAGSVIPPNATLIFEVELLEVK